MYILAYQRVLFYWIRQTLNFRPQQDQIKSAVTVVQCFWLTIELHQVVVVWGARGPARNLRRYTGLNLIMTRPPLTWSPSHIEKGGTRIFLWKPHTGTAGFEPGRMHDWRVSRALYPLHHVPFLCRGAISLICFFSGCHLFWAPWLTPPPPCFQTGDDCFMGGGGGHLFLSCQLSFREFRPPGRLRYQWQQTDTFCQCWINVGPLSEKLAQH